MEAAKAPITKHGFRFKDGAGQYDIGGYSFNPETADKEMWEHLAKIAPQHFVNVAKEEKAIALRHKQKAAEARAAEKAAKLAEAKEAKNSEKK